MWVTQFGWDGMEQTASSFFQPYPDVVPVDGSVTITVPVDAIITLSTIVTSARSLSECFPAPSSGLRTLAPACTNPLIFTNTH
jgi:hypothetical protein